MLFATRHHIFFFSLLPYCCVGFVFVSRSCSTFRFKFLSNAAKCFQNKCECVEGVSSELLNKITNKAEVQSAKKKYPAFFGLSRWRWLILTHTRILHGTMGLVSLVPIRVCGTMVFSIFFFFFLKTGEVFFS